MYPNNIYIKNYAEVKKITGIFTLDRAEARKGQHYVSQQHLHQELRRSEEVPRRYWRTARHVRQRAPSQAQRAAACPVQALALCADWCAGAAERRGQASAGYLIMPAEVITAALSLVGTLVGTLGGIALSSNLTNYRIEQLEKKVEKHNNLITRTYKLEQEFAVMDEKVKVANHRIDDLEDLEHES
nr:MAG TPA: hemolysin [Caudoviricetes sp.]